MKTWVHQRLASPTFTEDQEKTHLAGSLSVIMWAGLVYQGFNIAVQLVQARQDSTLLIDLCAFLATGLLFRWLRLGQVRQVGAAVSGLLFTWITLICINQGTIHTPATATYLFVGVLAGLLYGQKGLVISVTASSLAVMGLILAENAGLLPKTDQSVNFSQWVTCTGLFGLTGWLSYSANQAARQQLARAQQNIKEREHAELQLRKLTRAVEQSPSTIVITDLLGNIEYVNPRFSEITGYSFAEVVGQNPRILKTDLTPAETHLNMWTTLTAGKEWHGEFANRRKDGSIYYESAVIAPITDLNGAVTHYLAIKEDITESKHIRQHILWQRDLAQALAAATTIQAALKLCLEHLLQATNLDCGGIYLADRATGEFILAISHGLSDEFVQDAAQAPCGSLGQQVMAARQPVYSSADQIRAQNVPVLIHEGLRAYGVVPLRHQKQVIACFVLASHTVEDISATDRDMIEEIAVEVGSALVRIQAQEDLQHSHNELLASQARYRALFEQTHDAVFILDLEGRHLEVNQRAADMLGYTVAEANRLTVHETSGEIDRTQTTFARLLAGEQVPLYERPVRRKDGRLLCGEVSIGLVRDKNGSPLHIQSIIRDITQRKEAEEALISANEQLHQRILEVEQLQDELREQSLRDPLTGLYNRRYLSETMPREIVRTQRERSHLSVVMADIDHFKTINDTYGHQVGDKFLVEVANLMRHIARGSDIVCRYGGEEFLLVLPGASAETAARRAEDIRRKCAELVIQQDGRPLQITISLGVATFPDHSQIAEEVIHKADKALYNSKQAGRNQVSTWHEDAPAAGT